MPTSALIVDDEAHVRKFLKLVLGELGIAEIWEAANGEEALELVARHEPELMLLDLNMPVMDGMTVLRKVSRDYPEIPVVIVTGENSSSIVIECGRLGAVGYVLKTSPRAELIKNLSEAIGAPDDEDGPAAKA